MKLPVSLNTLTKLGTIKHRLIKNFNFYNSLKCSKNLFVRVASLFHPFKQQYKKSKISSANKTVFDIYYDLKLHICDIWALPAEKQQKTQVYEKLLTVKYKKSRKNSLLMKCKHYNKKTYCMIQTVQHLSTTIQ